MKRLMAMMLVFLTIPVFGHEIYSFHTEAGISAEYDFEGTLEDNGHLQFRVERDEALVTGNYDAYLYVYEGPECSGNKVIDWRAPKPAMLTRSVYGTRDFNVNLTGNCVETVVDFNGIIERDYGYIGA